MTLTLWDLARLFLSTFLFLKKVLVLHPIFDIVLIILYSKYLTFRRDKYSKIKKFHIQSIVYKRYTIPKYATQTLSF